MTHEEPHAAPDRAPMARRSFASTFDFVFPCLYALVWMGLGLVVQLRHFPIGDIDLETDFYGDLVIAARNLVEGRFSVHDFPWKGPVYALLLAPARWLAGDWYRGAVLLSAVCGGAYLVVGYRLLLRVYCRRVAVLSILSAPLVVEFFVHSHRAATDVPFMLLALGSMSFALLARASHARYATAGALAALAFLTRYNGLFLVLATALMLAVADPDRLPRSRRVRAFAAYLAAFLIVCAPWFIASGLATGQLIATRNADNVVAALYADASRYADPGAEVPRLRTLVARDPLQFVSRYARNLAVSFQQNLSVLFGWPLALVPLVGIVGLVVRPPTRRQAALYLFAAVYCLVTGVVFYAPRFYLPLILPFLALGFALVRSRNGAVVQVRSGWRARLRAPGGQALACAIAAAFVIAAGIVQVKRLHAAERVIYERRPLYLLEAAHVLAGHASGTRQRVLARKGHVAYYSGCDFTPYSTRTNSLEELVAAARNRDAQYVVYSKLEYSMLPRMLFMAIIDSIPFLQEIHRAESVRLFRVLDAGPEVLSDSDRYRLLLANLHAARQQRRPSAVYIASEDLGRHHLEQGEYAEAVILLQRALEFALRSNEEPGMAGAAAAARHLFATAQLGAGRPHEAISLLQENLAHFEALDVPAQIARTHEALAQAYEAQGRHDDARREREKAREKARE